MNNLKNILFFFFLLLSLQTTAQLTLSSKAEVAVITCGTGDQLYSAFGHSALRVYDPINNVDRIYNYGTFNFNKPNFYINFLKGNLIYELSTTSFHRFLLEYKYHKRWVKMQVLNLSLKDKQLIYNYLENNALPKNKEYKYDFFYDNCATKIEEVVQTALNRKINFSNSHITTPKTHRSLLKEYTKNSAWAEFGIDLALGSVTDKIISKDEYKFLPDYIYKAFNNATITINNETKPLVKKEITVLKEGMKKQHTITPIYIFSALLLFTLFFTYQNYKSKNKGKWLDFILFFITGSIGLIILLLWFATSHTATYKNLNILWAFAPNLLVAFVLLKRKLPKWIVGYTYTLLLFILLLILIWIFKIQQFNFAIIPILFSLVIRYFFIIYNNRNKA